MTSSLGHGWSKLASVALLFEALRDFYKKCFWTKFGNMQKFVLGFRLKIVNMLLKLKCHTLFVNMYQSSTKC